MLYLPIEWVMAFAIHRAQKVVVILKLEQLEYLLMAAPHLLPVEMQGFFGRMVVTFIVLGEGLPIPGIDFFEDFPLLTLAVANLELANSL